MKNILQIILISFFTFTIISCAKESGSSSSSTITTTMSSPFVEDGNYKWTAVERKIYYKSSGGLSGGLYQTDVYSITHDNATEPGYFGYGMEWKGSGVYRITVFGKATYSISGESTGTSDCTINDIKDITFDENGNKTDSTIIQTGCGGSSSSTTNVSDTYTSYSDGFIRVKVTEDTNYQYKSTFTFLKQ